MIFGQRRFLGLVLGGVSSVMAQEFDSAGGVRLLDYGRFPAAANKHANWLYVVQDSRTPGHTLDLRVTILDPAAQVTTWNGPSSSYRRTAVQVIEEQGRIAGGKLQTDGIWGRGGYSRSWESWDITGKCAFVGEDVWKGKRRAESKLVPVYRVDPGLVYPARMKVGEVLRSQTGYYEDGEYLGEVPYSIRLVERGPVKVPAGLFPDCIRLRVSIGPSGEIDEVDEWWAKGIGVIRTKNREYQTRHQLVAYNLKGSAAMTPGTLRLEGGAEVPSRRWLREVSFPPTSYGSSSEAVNLKLLNQGDGPLEVTWLEEPVDDSAFGISGLPVRFTIPARQGLAFTARFSPSSSDSATFSQRLSFMTSNEMDGIWTFDLIGTSPAP